MAADGVRRGALLAPVGSEEPAGRNRDPFGDQARGDSAFEAALLAGATRMAGCAQLAGPPSHALGRFVLVWALAATNVTPALLFLSSASGVTAGPGILILAGQGGNGPSQAAALRSE